MYMLSKCSRSVSFLTLAFLLSPLSDFSVDARWGEEDEANTEVLNKTMIFKIKKDGTWILEEDTQKKILTEAGRESATQTFFYDATRETFEVLEAKTIDSEGTEHVILRERIEDKPLASEPLGLSKQHQILLPFDCVAVGSVLHLKTRESYFKPVITEYFASSLRFGLGARWKEADIIFESELPLFLKINDPRESLTVKEVHDDFKHTLHISVKKTIFEELVNEPEHCYDEPDLFTSISVSTEKNYERIGKNIATFYKHALQAPLPEALEEIRKTASPIEDEIECIETIAAEIIAKVNYFGNWNVATGQHSPQSPEAVFSSKSGDCKDFASCFTLALNKLEKGYKAKIALVERNEVHLEEKGALPNLDLFNHAIVKVISPSEKVYWIDPTNNVSMATGIFPDIADRFALVLDLENPTYERIPPIDYRHSISRLEKTITIGKEDVKFDGFFSLEGESAKSLTEELNTYPHTVIQEDYIKKLCASTDPINPCITLPEFCSRRVMPLKITFSYGDDHAMNHTNHGDAFTLRSNWHGPYIGSSLKNERALYVGSPGTIIIKKTFKNVSATNLSSLAFSLQTPWLNAKRELADIEGDTIVTDTIEKLSSIISAKDLKSDGYANLKKTLRRYCDRAAIIFDR